MAKLKVLFLFFIFIYVPSSALGLSIEEHSKLKLGMNYKQVEAILGFAGEEMRFPNLPTNQKMFRWKDGKSWIGVTFVDDSAASITSSTDLATEAQRKYLKK